MSFLSPKLHQTFAAYGELPRLVHLLCLGSLVNRAGAFVLVFLSIYAKEELHLGDYFGPLAVGVLGLGSIVGSLVGGQLADRVGRRPTLLLALGSASILLVVMSRMTGPVGFLSAVFLFAACGDMYRPAAMAMLSDLTSAKQREYAFSLNYVAINLGFAIAPPLGGFLASLSYDLLFWGDAVTTGLYGLLVFLAVPETRPSVEPSDEGVSESAGRNAPGWGDTVRQVCGDRAFLFYCLCTLLSAMVFMQSFSTLPLFIKGLGYTEAEYGLMVAVNGLMIVLLQIPVTHAVTRFDRIRLMIIGEALIAAGFAAYAVISGPASIIGAIAVWTIGEIIQAPIKQSIVADLAPESFRGRYMGMFSLCFAIAMTFGAPLGGFLLPTLGSTAFWIVCGGVSFGTLLMYALGGARLRRALGRFQTEETPAANGGAFVDPAVSRMPATEPSAETPTSSATA